MLLSSGGDSVAAAGGDNMSWDGAGDAVTLRACSLGEGDGTLDRGIGAGDAGG